MVKKNISLRITLVNPQPGTLAKRLFMFKQIIAGNHGFDNLRGHTITTQSKAGPPGLRSVGATKSLASLSRLRVRGVYDMHQVELIPELTHCIETVAKNEYRETLRQLLAASEGTEELEEKVELLRIFLETMDFNKLRRESEKHLLQGRKVTFVVYREGGTAKYDLRVEAFPARVGP